MSGERFIIVWEIIVNAPEERDPDGASARWSEADKRLFLITFLGGLGANIGVVLVVAAGIAFNRFEKSHWSYFSYFIAIILGAGGAVIAYLGAQPVGRRVPLGWVHCSWKRSRARALSRMTSSAWGTP
jgi:hypothetical protein